MARCAYEFNASEYRTTGVPADSCNEAYVVVSVGEYQQYKQLLSGELGNNPWSITPEQGALIGGAILLVWAAAWVFRTLIRLLLTSDEERNDA